MSRHITLTREQVRQVQADANVLINRNNKRYSIITTSSIVTDEMFLKLHDPKKGLLVLPPEVCQRMGRPARSKFITTGQQIELDISRIKQRESKGKFKQASRARVREIAGRIRDLVMSSKKGS